MSQPASTLPRLPEFLTTLIPIAAPITDKCSICQEIFEDEPEDVVQVPCGHPHHRHCILEWFHSISDRRNTCPYCRTELFRINLLTPQQAAARQADEDEANALATGLDLVRFESLMRLTDDLFAVLMDSLTPSRGPPNFLAVVEHCLLCFRIDHGSEVYLSDQHREVGDVWIRWAVASRLVDLIETSDVEQNENSVRDLRSFIRDLFDDSDPESDIEDAVFFDPDSDDASAFVADEEELASFERAIERTREIRRQGHGSIAIVPDLGTVEMQNGRVSRVYYSDGEIIPLALLAHTDAYERVGTHGVFYRRSALGTASLSNEQTE